MYSAVTCMTGDGHAMPSKSPDPIAKPCDKGVVELNWMEVTKSCAIRKCKNTKVLFTLLLPTSS